MREDEPICLAGAVVENPAEAGTTLMLAEHLARVAKTPLAADDIEAIRKLFLDNFIVSLWGATRPWTAEITQWARRFSGTGGSPILAADCTSEPSIAALVHGTAAHSFELDDTHDETLSHPGAPIIAAALAVAADLKASLADLFDAVAVGYEAMTLAGAAVGGMETVHRGFHPTSVFGSFGAAAACLVLLARHRQIDIGRDALVAAFGHALSQACGSMQFSVEPTGGEVKRVHAGFAARNGVLAAEFALMPNVTAPRLAIEGSYGLAALFGGALRQITPSASLQVRNISFKPYACCRLFHSTIDALAQVTDGFDTPLADIEEIVVRGPQLIADQHMLARPQSAMAAQYSCPFIVGATLVYGPQRFDAYSANYLDDAAIVAVAAKVRFELDAELTQKYYPTRFATAVRLKLTDGRSRSALVVNSLGTQRKPLTRELIISKGAGLGRVAGVPVGEVLAKSIWHPAIDAARLAQALASVANQRRD